MKRNCLSDANNQAENPYEDRDNAEKFKNIEYKQRIQLETLFFDKYREDEGYSKIEYGKAVNKLTIDSHTILFKEIAEKNVDDKNKICDNFMYIFDIPAKFQTKSAVSFLLYKFPFSWSKEGDDYSNLVGKLEGRNSGEIEGENAGVYVIRKKKLK